MVLEDVAREAMGLPRHQRLALARLLIELDDPGSDADVEAAWEAEIQARLRAVKEGHVQGIPYEQVLARVDRRLGLVMIIVLPEAADEFEDATAYYSDKQSGLGAEVPGRSGSLHPLDRRACRDPTLEARRL